MRVTRHRVRFPNRTRRKHENSTTEAGRKRGEEVGLANYCVLEAEGEDEEEPLRITNGTVPLPQGYYRTLRSPTHAHMSDPTMHFKI